MGESGGAIQFQNWMALFCASIFLVLRIEKIVIPQKSRSL